jgi:hypothetical protein
VDIFLITLVFCLTAAMLAALGFGLAWSILHLRRKYLQDSIVPLPSDGAGNFLPVADLRSNRVIQAAPGNFAQPVPHSITYSPHSVTHVKQVEAAPMAELPALAAPSMVVPSFADLLGRGEIGLDAGLKLGWSTEDNRLISGSWLDLYSAAIGGISGSGKTTTVRYLTGQSALMGARFILIDPHAAISEESLAATLAPLSQVFLCEVASDDRAIVAALALASRELDKRRKEGPGFPLIICVDEFSMLMRREAVAGPLQQLLLDVSQEGRKMGIFCLVMAQIWKGSTNGGTELRDSFASAFVHRMKRNQARLLLPSDEVKEFEIERLPAGRAILYKTSGDIVPLAIPNTTAADMRRVAGLLPGVASDRFIPASSGLPGGFPSGAQVVETKPERSPFEATSLVASMASQSAKTLSAEDARILAMFKAEKTIGQIVKEVYGVSGGAGYQKAAEEVQAAIRRAV